MLMIKVCKIFLIFNHEHDDINHSFIIINVILQISEFFPKM